MNLLARWRLARLLTGVGLTLSASVPFAPATARASCGDYLLVGGPHIGDASHADPHIASSAMPHPARRVPAAPGHGGPPCSGAMCSRGPLSLPLSSAPASPVQ